MKNKKTFLFTILLIAVVMCFSWVLLRSSGDASPEAFKIVLLSLFILFTSSSSKAYWIVMFPITIIIALYAPVGFDYGYPTYQYVASLVATDASEAFEFLSLVPLTSYLMAALIIPASILIYKATRKLEVNLFRNKFLTTVAVCSFFLMSGVFTSFEMATKSIKGLNVEYSKLKNFASQNNWKKVIQTKQTKYDDYILVVGESARKDYFHTYGYPVKNTPFLDSTNGTIVDGLKSAGTYTIGSLRLMLTQGDKLKREPDYNLNLMDLANKAGFKTYWISNQGQLGEWDTPISSIGKRADVSYFLKSTGYDVVNVSDYALLGKVKEILNEKTDKKEKRLIVIHTMGSHPNACLRVSDMQKRFEAKSKENEYVACYISSIYKTDNFLKELVDLAKTNTNNRSFSLIYFADHGLAHIPIDGQIVLSNNGKSKFHHDVPFVKISSDDKTRKVIKSEKSGLLFVNGLAQWMGLRGLQLQPYNLFDGKSDKYDFGISQDPYKYTDPAMDISKDLVIKEYTPEQLAKIAEAERLEEKKALEEEAAKAGTDAPPK